MTLRSLVGGTKITKEPVAFIIYKKQGSSMLFQNNDANLPACMLSQPITEHNNTLSACSKSLL
jgi:hypothetical protein